MTSQFNYGNYLSTTDCSKHCATATVDTVVEVLHRRTELRLRLRLNKYRLLLLNTSPDS